MFSPGNLRATFDNPAYERLISHYIGEKYTLRYTGGMVPDVFQVSCSPQEPRFEFDVWNLHFCLWQASAESRPGLAQSPVTGFMAGAGLAVCSLSSIPGASSFVPQGAICMQAWQLSTLCTSTASSRSGRAACLSGELP